jgi:3D (Asp-Asp-Asp) domain-containing protein
MQGTGRISDGRYIRLASMNTTWHRTNGHMDRVDDQSQVTFAYTDAVHGRYAILQTDLSAAIDPLVIPPHARFDISGIGVRRADDVGSAIRNYHIDNFLGAGQAVVTAWLARGITDKDVKFLGYK